MKKIGIYDPYLHILGGAERYVLSIAACLKKDAEAILFGGDGEVKKKAAEKFGLDVNQLTDKPWSSERGKRNSEMMQIDLMFYVTDGSLFFSRAKKNILIIQSPAHIPGNSLTNQFKFLSWQKVVCYSEFMADIIKEKLGRRAEVLFVPISGVASLPTRKKNFILSVGRFFPHLHNKKQKEMVELFRKMVKRGLKNMELCLVGSVDPGGEDYLAEVKRTAEGLPVRILTDITHTELQRLYTDAKVYWHAAGFGEDLEKHPEKAEHFGVSTVEAQAYGAVPVVFAGGGQTEIVNNGHNGFVWRNSEELLKYTKELLSNEALRSRLARNAQTSANQYTQDKFCDRLHEILNHK